MKICLWIIAASMLVVVLEGLASYFVTSNFLPSQVVARWGKAGISFVAHGGMWGDLFLLPPLFAFIIVKYGEGWTTKQILLMGAIGIAVTLGNHINLILNQQIPDPLGWQKEWFSIPIVLHFFYMSLYVALIGLFYFCSPVSVKAAIMVSVLLGVHTAFGTHIPLGLLNLWHQWDWCPTTFLTNPGILPMTVGIWTALSAMAWVAAGWQAGLSVASIASCLAGVVAFIISISPAQN